MIESCNQLSEELNITVAMGEGTYTEIGPDIRFCMCLKSFISGDSELEIQIVPHGLGISEETQVQFLVARVVVHLTPHLDPHVFNFIPIRCHF